MGIPKITQANRDALGEKKLRQILKRARSFSFLAHLGPSSPWHVDIRWVNRPQMAQFNRDYRKKNEPTDILSFPAIEVFREKGFLGELVICLPILRAQAKALKHSVEWELEVLLIHGVLHLLGLDHEKSKKQAAQMAQWESKILPAISPASCSGQQLGLIHRSGSGI